MGYIRGFVHGAAAGTVIGLCIAPQNGKKTREQLAVFARGAREGYQATERAVRKVSPLVISAVPWGHHGEDVEIEETDSRVHIHDHTNGHSPR